MRPAHHRRFIPRCVELESRDVPAGNVTVTLSNSNGLHLQIDGDADDNTVILRGRGPGVIEVQGVNTTLNGGNKKLTFTGVGTLLVDTSDGNDSLQTQDLAVGFIGVLGGAGDDRIHLNRSTDPYGITIWADDSFSIPNDSGANGEDTIRVSGTNASGYLSLEILGDTNGDARHDTISLENTNITDGGFDEVGFNILMFGGLGPGAGDDITIDDFDVSGDVVGAGWFATVYGSPGDDHIRIRNCDIVVQTERVAFGDFYVDGVEGDDTVEVENVTHLVTTTRTVGAPFELVNQVFVGIFADTVRVNNLDFVGGGKFSDPSGEYYTGGGVSILGSEVDLRNTSIHTNGYGGLYVSSPEWLDGIEREDSWSLANVRVTSAHGRLGELSLDAGGGNDRIALTNASCETFFAYLGEGDDTLRMTNVSGDVFLEFGYGGIYGGGGNDTVGMANCTFRAQLIDLGEGDDDLALVNTSFVELVADLGDGDDTATVHNNTATVSLAINGGDGTDALIAWGNVAPLIEFDNFEN